VKKRPVNELRILGFMDGKKRRNIMRREKRVVLMQSKIQRIDKRLCSE
jgi:hypothetical protein